MSSEPPDELIHIIWSRDDVESIAENVLLTTKGD